MRKNCRRRRKLSSVAEHTMHIGAVLLMAFAMAILNVLASMSGNQLMKSIGEKERKLESLEETRVRESTHWEMMKSTEGLEKALMHNGLAMRCPHADQIIRMRADGRPYAGQPSLARLRNSDAAPTARYVGSRRR